jgi:hypothetical protein
VEAIMATKFADFVREIEAEAKAEGPEAVAQLETFRDHFRVGRKLAQARLAKKLSQKQVASQAKVDQGDLWRPLEDRAWPCEPYVRDAQRRGTRRGLRDRRQTEAPLARAESCAGARRRISSTSILITPPSPGNAAQSEPIRASLTLSAPRDPWQNLGARALIFTGFEKR